VHHFVVVKSLVKTELIKNTEQLFCSLTRERANQTALLLSPEAARRVGSWAGLRDASRAAGLRRGAEGVWGRGGLRAAVCCLASQPFVAGLEEGRNRRNALCSVPVTWLPGCNLGKLVLLQPAVTRMKYSFSCGVVLFYGRGFAFVARDRPAFPSCSRRRAGLGGSCFAVARGCAGVAGGGTGSDLFQKLCCRRLRYFFLLLFVTGILVCRDHSWPGSCGLMVSVCSTVGAGVVCEGVLLHRSHRAWGCFPGQLQRRPSSLMGR